MELCYNLTMWARPSPAMMIQLEFPCTYPNKWEQAALACQAAIIILE